MQKEKQNSPAGDPSPQKKSSLSKRMDKLKHHIADFLQAESNKLSHELRKTFFIMFGLFLCALSVGSIIRAVKSDDHADVKIGSIQIPNVDTTGALWDPLVSEVEYQKVIAFKMTMDSLRQTRKGKRLYDSLRENRKGLFDSVDRVVALYLIKR